MSPLNACLRRPITVAVLVVALCLGGLLAVLRMPRDIFPPLGIPTLYVAQPYGGMDPAQMEGAFTYYYEYHFLYITGIEHVESRNIQGAALMKLQFHPGTDMSAALAETVAYVNRARAFMPPGTPGPFVTRFDAGSVAVGQLVFSTDNPNRTVGQMQDAALNQVRPLFATLPGVSAPPPFGGSARTITVNLKPDRLRALGISPDDVVQAFASANLISPSGNITVGDQSLLAPANALARNIRDLDSTPIRQTPSGVIYARDVATLADASDLVTSYALVNGRRTVYMPVTKRADASTLAVVDLVKNNLPKFQAAVPDDIRVSYELDQSPIVTRAIHDLIKEGLLGAVLTGLTVLLFLRDWRTALVVLLHIPMSLLAATFGLWLTNQGIHLMTLGGLALSIGVLVDEATVAVENLHTHRSKGAPLATASVLATRETALPRLLAMLCVVASFLPALFMTGAARALFLPLALTVAFAMAASYVLSSAIVPILCIWLLPATSPHNTLSSSWFSTVHAAYSRLVSLAIRLRFLIVPAYLILSASTLAFTLSRLGFEIFPTTESNQFALRIRAPAGTRLDATEKLALKILDLIQAEAGPTNVSLSLGLVGVHAPNYPVNLIHLWNSGPEEAHLSVQFHPNSKLDLPTLKDRLRSRAAREFPELLLSFEPSDIVSRVMSFGAPTPIEVAVSGPNLATNRLFAEKLQSHLAAIPTLCDIQLVQSLQTPTIEVNVNRERAGQMGVRVSDVTRSLVAATASSRFTTPNYWSDPASGVSYNLQIQIPPSEMRSLDDLQNLPVSTQHDRSVLLRNVASLKPGTAPGVVERYNMARVVSISANLRKTDLGHALRQLQQIPEIHNPKLWPPRTRVDVRGQALPLSQLQDGFRSGLGVAIIVVLLLLIAFFQSLRLATIAVATLPAVLAGSTLTLLLTGATLNLQSAIGIIMGIGVALANAILLVTFAERARQTTPSTHHAALAGATSRLRPILMTTSAMIAGMLPLALGLGESGPQTAPLGRAVAGALAASTLATLFVVPALFAWLAPSSIHRPSLDPEDPTSAHFQPPQSPV